MKFHWGHGITIFFIVFVVFIVAMVLKSTQNGIHLVTENYYEAELKFQDHIDMVKNTNDLAEKPMLTFTGNKVAVAFPEGLRTDVKDGNILLFRPSNSRFDQNYPLKLDEQGQQQIDLSQAVKGNYRVQMKWSDSVRDYFSEITIFIQ